MITAAVIGMGVRGKVYSDIMSKFSERVKIVAVCDPNEKQLEYAITKYDVKKDFCFNNDTCFFESGKLADALLICTQDSQHFEHAMKGLELGYDLLIEKPISNSLEECILLEEKAKALGRIISVCHELRYTPFCLKIKELIDCGELGSVMTINHTERVGYYHYAHSFVRGNWRKEEESSPMLLAKCCHDLDLISFFAGGKCKSVSSFGSLSFFTDKNRPQNSDEYCYKCRVSEDCPYNAINFYQTNKRWIDKTGLFFNDFNENNVLKWLSDENNPYARCVFCSDNDVVDHQVVNMLFDNGVCAHLTMTAFSKGEGRDISINCTYGEIHGNMETNVITVKPFGKDEYIININEIIDSSDGHAGGDKGLVEDYILQLEKTSEAKCLTSIENSVYSHTIAFMAEKSRVSGGSAIEIKLV